MVKPREELLGAITLLDKYDTGLVNVSNADVKYLKSVILTARASAPNTGDGYGAFWVGEGNPTTAKFTDSLGNTITLGSGGGGGAVSSVFGRAGDVVAVAGDYGSTLVDNQSTVDGYSVTDALNTLKAAIPTVNVTSVFGRTGAVTASSGDYTSTQVTNSSTVTGVTVTNALDTLKSSIPSTSSQITNASLTVTGSTVSNALDNLKAAIAYPVTSVFTRTGSIVAASGDYNSTQVTNSSTVTGSSVTDALNTLKSSIPVVSYPVVSVFSRTGAVVSASGDYNSTQITNSSTVTGVTVTNALDNLKSLIPTVPVSSVFGRTGAITATSGDYTSTLITNSSTVTGTTVTAALNALLAAIPATSSQITNASSTVSGSTVSNALDNLKAAIPTVSYPVTSVFGRTGAVVAVSGDYTSTTVTNSSTVTGSTVTDALNNIKGSLFSLSSTTPANIVKGTSAVGVGTTAARADHQHDITTATAVSVGTSNAEGTATSVARSDHTHQVTGLAIASQAQGDILYYNGSSWVRLPASTDGYVLATHGAGANPSWILPSSGVSLTSIAPVTIVKGTSAVGVASTAARGDHQHDIQTASAVAIGTVNAEGSSTSLARADHTHQVTGLAITSQVQGSVLYFNGTNWVQLSPGTSGNFLTTQGAGANPTWSAGIALSSTTPANVVKGTSAVGVGTTAARSDHQHDITTASAVSVGTANAEGTATSVARSDHTHQVTGLAIASQAQGDILYYNGSSWVRLPASTDGYVLLTHAAGQNPTWGLVNSGALAPGGAYQARITNSTGTASAWQTLTLGATSPVSVTNSGNVVQGTTISVNTVSNTTSGVVPSVGTTGTVLQTSNGTAASWALLTSSNLSGTAGITPSQLSTGGANQAITSNGTTNSWGTLTLGATAPIAVSNSGNVVQGTTISVASATTGALGVIQLAGDLAGTATSVTVAKINGAGVPAVGTLAQGDVLYYNGTAWTRLAAGTSGNYLTTQGAGANPTWGLISAGGISPGTAYQAHVTNSGGTASAWQTLTLGATAPIAVSNSGNVVQGTTISVASATTGALGVVQLAGDLAGTATSVTVAKINGAGVPAVGTLAQGDVLYYNGSAWVRLAAGTSGNFLTTQGAGANPAWSAGLALSSTTPANVVKGTSAVGVGTTAARSDHQHDITTASAVSVGTTNAEGTATSVARSDHTHAVTGLNIASQVQGSVLYYNGSAWVQLAPGTSGNILTTQGASANPVWASAPVTSVFGRTGAVVSASGDYTSTQITNSSTVSGATVTAALNTLAGTVPTLSSVLNSGNITGSHYIQVTDGFGLVGATAGATILANTLDNISGFAGNINLTTGCGTSGGNINISAGYAGAGSTSGGVQVSTGDTTNGGSVGGFSVNLGYAGVNGNPGSIVMTSGGTYSSYINAGRALIQGGYNYYDRSRSGYVALAAHGNYSFVTDSFNTLSVYEHADPNGSVYAQGWIPAGNNVTSGTVIFRRYSGLVYWDSGNNMYTEVTERKMPTP